MKKILSCFIIFLSLLCRNASAESWTYRLSSAAKPHLTSRGVLLGNPANPSPMKSGKRLSFDYERMKVVGFPEEDYDEYSSKRDIKALSADFLFDDVIVSAGYAMSQKDTHMDILNGGHRDSEARGGVPAVQLTVLASEFLTVSFRMDRVGAKMEEERETPGGERTKTDESASYQDLGFGVNYRTEENWTLGLFFSPEADDKTTGHGRILQLGIGYAKDGVFSCGLDFVQTAENEDTGSIETEGFLLSGEAKIWKNAVLEAGYENYNSESHRQNLLSAGLIVPIESFSLRLGLSRIKAEFKDSDAKYELLAYNIGVLSEF